MTPDANARTAIGHRVTVGPGAKVSGTRKIGPGSKVGLIGLGLMGRPMGINLLKAGYSLTVWNRTASRAESLVAAGAKLASSPAEVAAASEVLITIVSDPPALEEVLWGGSGKGGGALGELQPGSIYIDSSTVSPGLARKIAAACAERQVDFLDAPVTGGTWGAEKGELVFMVGGDAQVLKDAEPVISVMGKRWFLLGPNAAGQTIKLAMNLILALEVDALAEGLALVTAAGLKGEKLVEVLQSSMGRAAVLDVKAPLLLKREYAPSFPLRLMHKDVGLALQLAKEVGVTLPAGAAAYATYSAVKDAAKEDLDYAAVMKFWDR
ncbi:MAG TPA: NAD(P)-binding domain-containing protein [Candidatus Solibacter sp.]|nr:NAD(P)-binding domain-containing protein [Candidatus Solibacter sp.]